MEVLRRLAHELIRPYRVRRARAMRQGGPWVGVRLPPGISEVATGARVPASETWVTHPLDLDIGEVADGYHLIARSIGEQPDSDYRRNRIARLTFDLVTGQVQIDT